MWMVRKRKNNMFNNQMEPKIAKRLLKRMKTFLIVAGFSFLVFIFGAIMHNVLHGVSEIEETTFFFIALVALLVFIVATAGSMVIFLKERQKTI
jgi:adenosine/AMP kinase